MEEKLTPEIIIESLRNSFFKEKGIDVAYHIGKYADWLESKIVDYRLLPNLDKSSANWAKVNDKDKWFDEVRGNDIVGEGKRAEAIRFYDWLHREGYSFSDRPHRVYYGGKYYWIQDIYKKFATSTPPVKVDEGKAEELKEFLEYTQEARNQFSNYINSREWDNKLRTECESLLICFDQLKERYTTSQNQPSNK